MSKEMRNLILFFTVTLVVTNIAYFTIVLAGLSPYEFPGLILFLLGGSAPSWVGLLFVFITYDKGQRKAYFSRLSPRLISARWWAVIVFCFPILYALVYAIEIPLFGGLPGLEPLKQYVAQPQVLPLVFLMGIFSGPIPEEFGWRGYALDPLMRRFGRIPGSVILGLIWGIWHLGLFFMPQTWHGQMGFRFAGFATFILASIGLALLMTWVHLNTHGSILAAILMHFFNNFTSTTLYPHPDQVEILRMILLLVAGFTLCLMMDRRDQIRRAATAPG